MNMTVPGRLSLLLIFLVLTGCSALSELNISRTPEAGQTFNLALDQYIDTGDLTRLRQIPKQYPKGEWRYRAEAIIDLAEQQQALQAQQKAAGGKLELCEKEKKRLADDNRILDTTLERLKQVLIDTELRSE